MSWIATIILLCVYYKPVRGNRIHVEVAEHGQYLMPGLIHLLPLYILQNKLIDQKNTVREAELPSSSVSCLIISICDGSFTVTHGYQNRKSVSLKSDSHSYYATTPVLFSDRNSKKEHATHGKL